MLRDQQVQPTSDGREAMENIARSFWQSRISRAGAPAPLPQLTNLEQLARDVRNADPYYIKPTRAMDISDSLNDTFNRIFRK